MRVFEANFRLLNSRRLRLISSAAPTPDLTPSAPVHPAPPSAGHCLNCHQRLAGPYCHHCGQAASTPARITGHHLLHELPHSIWHVDHGLVYTVREMLRQPGPTIPRYLAGERKRFFNPLSLLLLIGGISAFLFAKLHIVLFGAHQPGVPAQVQQVQQQMMQIAQQYQAWLSILFLPIAATVATPLLRRATGYSWAEQLLAAALLSGALASANLLFIPALAYWSGQPAIGTVVGLMTLVMLGYKTWGYAQLQAATAGPGRPVRRWLRGVLVAITEYVGTIVLFAVALLIVVLLRR